MKNFGKKITDYEQHNNSGVEFNDDIVQNIFDKDCNYLKLYNSPYAPHLSKNGLMQR